MMSPWNDRVFALGLTEELLSAYKLYYAIYFLTVRRSGGGLLQWCRQTIRAACEA